MKAPGFPHDVAGSRRVFKLLVILKINLNGCTNSRMFKCLLSSLPFLLQKNSRLYQVSVGQCLAVLDPLSHKGYVAMAICDGSEAQQWQLEG